MSAPSFDQFVEPEQLEVPDEQSTTVNKKARKRVKSAPRRRMRRNSKQDVADSIRSLAMMLSVQRGELGPVRTLANQYEGTKLGLAYDRVADNISGGTPFSEAFAQEDVFPAVARRMVMVGASTGNPAPHLTKAADLLDEALATSSKVRSALLEPTILGVGVVIFFIAMVTWAVPQMVEVFASTGAPLPVLSQIALSVANVLQVVIPVLIAVGLGVWGWWRKVGRKSDVMRAKLDAWTLRLPVIGSLHRDAALANCLSVLAALTELGISERAALTTAAEGCDNRAIGAHLRTHARNITEGNAQFADLADGLLIPLPVGTVLSAAVNSGSLPLGLAHVADTYRRSSKTKSDNLSTTLGPAANIVVGALFAGAVIIIYVPMYSMFTAMTAF